MTAPVSSFGFRRFSTAVIGATLLVILWGAYVRASGSGAGCGAHWPTCNGQVIPRAPSVQTIVEFTHRVTSGLAFILVFAQYVLARRVFARGHGARRAAGYSLFFMVTEALVGGGLVLFEMVAQNESIARAWWMTGHLLNTFALVAALTLTWWCAGRRPALDLPRTAFPLALNVALAGVALVALSGAIAALGDTLFPARSLTEGFAQDLSVTAHAYLRLRLWHPFLAVGIGVYLFVLVGRILQTEGLEPLRSSGTLVAGLVAAQLLLGLVNLLLLAPIALQLAHLLVADVLWISLVVLRARVSPSTPQPQAVAQEAAALTAS